MDLSQFAGHTITVYFRTWQDGAFTLQMMYVDDIVIDYNHRHGLLRQCRVRPERVDLTGRGRHRRPGRSVPVSLTTIGKVR